MARPSVPHQLAACALLAATVLAAAARDDKAHWGYEGKNGAQAWGDLEPAFSFCKLGQFQSPIDIRDADAKKAALKPVFDKLPGKEGGKHALKSALNLTDLLPAERAYYRFKGSLTTPPCSEEVSWQVLKQPVEISKAQLQAFRKLYRMNARPTQPLNGRTVEQN